MKYKIIKVENFHPRKNKPLVEVDISLIDKNLIGSVINLNLYVKIYIRSKFSIYIYYPSKDRWYIGKIEDLNSPKETNHIEWAC